MAAAEQVKLLGLRLEQNESEQLAVQRHRSALDGGSTPTDVLQGIERAGQVVNLELDVRAIDRPLEHLPVDLEE